MSNPRTIRQVGQIVEERHSTLRAPYPAGFAQFGKHAGGTLTARVEPDCPVHNPREAARVVTDPPYVIAPAAEQETEEEAAQREAEHEQRMAEYRAEQERKKEERKAEFGRQQKEYEAEQARRGKQRKTRLVTQSRATSARGSESCSVATGSLTSSDRVESGKAA